MGTRAAHQACTQLSKHCPSHLSEHLGLGKQARPTHILSLYNTPSQLHTRARRGSRGGGGAASSWHHKPPLPSPQPRSLKHFHYLPGNLTHHPARKQTECPLHTPQHPGAYKILQSVTKMAYQSHRALAKGPVWR